jgi:hypothetical protein
VVYGGPRSRARRSKVDGGTGVMGSWGSRRGFLIRVMMTKGDWGLGRAQGSSSGCDGATGFFPLPSLIRARSSFSSGGSTRTIGG